MLSLTRRTCRDKRNQNIKFLEKWVHRNRNRPKTSSNTHLTKECWRKKSQESESPSSKHDVPCSPQNQNNSCCQKKRRSVPNLILKFSESEGSSDENEFFNLEAHRSSHQRTRCYRKRRFSKGDLVEPYRSCWTESNQNLKKSNPRKNEEEELIIADEVVAIAPSIPNSIFLESNSKSISPFFQTPAAPSIPNSLFEASSLPLALPSPSIQPPAFGFFSSPFFNLPTSSKPCQELMVINPSTSTSSSPAPSSTETSCLNLLGNPLINSSNIVGMIRGDVTCYFKAQDDESSILGRVPAKAPTSNVRNPFIPNALIDGDGDVVMEDASERRYSTLFAKDRRDLGFPIYNVFECGVIALEFAHVMINQFKQRKVLHETIVDYILSSASNLFEKLPNCIEVTCESSDKCTRHITVVGDTHGQFFDMLQIFEKNGYPSENNWYLFNGDFVDRGEYGCEIVLTLCLFKLIFPNAVHLLRGNHECREINMRHGFETEVLSKYSASVFESFQNTFSVLPISAVINKKIFVCHGGLSEKADLTIREINHEIERKGPIPCSGIFTDLLWSDPRSDIVGVVPSERGASICFGLDRVKTFLKNNNLSMIIRSHEFKAQGYETMGLDDQFENPLLITVFSAPNYVGKMQNLGGYIRFENDSAKPEFFQFCAADVKDAETCNSIFQLGFESNHSEESMYNYCYNDYNTDEVMSDENDFVYG